MLAFIVRRCTVDLGHKPSAAELAAWSNACASDPESRHLFGRPISESEAALILKHQTRLVSAKSARPFEEYVEADELQTMLRAPSNVVSLTDRLRRSSR